MYYSDIFCLKDGKLGTIVAKHFIENKKVIIEGIKKHKKSAEIREELKRGFFDSKVSKKFHKDLNEVFKESLRIALYFGTEEYDTSFLYDDSMRGIKESAIDITFERYFKEGINYEKLKKMINELSDIELDKRNFIEFIEKQALLSS